MSEAPHSIDFYFDFACPYAYLASTRIDELAAHTGAQINLKPVLLGGIFRALNQPQNMSTTLSPAKAKHNRLDLLRWASWLEVPLQTPLRHPNRSVEALRFLLASPGDYALSVMTAFYELYWAQSADISDVEVLKHALRALDLDAEAIASKASSDAVKDSLRERTQAAVELGIFGVPTFVVGGEVFFGQDRVEMVAEAAMGWTAREQLVDSFSFNQETNKAQ
jgi:2-hydroxychromene-2-carboxylate isomerase